MIIKKWNGTAWEALSPQITLDSITATGRTATNFLRGDSTWTALPTATQSNSGVVTTGSQTFGGLKTFNNNIALGSGTETWTIDDSEANTLTFKLASTETEIKFKSGDGIYFEGTKLGSGSSNDIDGGTWV